MKIARYIFLLVVVILLFWLLAGCQSGASPQTTTGEPTFELRVDILGRTHIVYLDSEGRLTMSAALASPDKAVTLSIDKGTTLLDKNGKPLSSIWIIKEQKSVSPPRSAKVLTSIYNLGPVDITFDHALKLTLSYDPQELPEGIEESEVYIAPYGDGSGWEQSYYKRMDTENHRITTLVSSCGNFAVLVPVTLEPEPPNTALSANLLEVVYFHRPQRCSGCVYAETVTRYTLETYFAKELVSGRIVFKVINLADEANAAIIEHYSAYTSSLFINSQKNGDENMREVKEIWLLLGKDSEFVTLVKSRIAYYLSGEIP